MIDKKAQKCARASKSRQNRKALAVKALAEARAVTDVHKVDHGGDISLSPLTGKGAVRRGRSATERDEYCLIKVV
ncbi:hypothetical protein [Albirhodobacter sp. R86504]|uniref:hypothetical protein n=1 Tax=Albirhodobacter sp. R86504 TaxID=3093848 RepID=UPI00366CFBE7